MTRFIYLSLIFPDISDHHHENHCLTFSTPNVKLNRLALERQRNSRSELKLWLECFMSLFIAAFNEVGWY